MQSALALVAIVEAAALVYVVRLFLRGGEAREAAHARERAKLLDRIQAPKVAVQQSITEGLPPSPPSVGFDNDEDYWKAQEAVSGRA